MCWKELCRWFRRPSTNHGEEASSPPRSKTRPPDSGDLSTTSKREPAGVGDAAQSVATIEASGSHKKSSTAEASDSNEKSSTQSTPPNTGDHPYDQEPKGQGDTINQTTKPNNARGAAMTSYEKFSASKDQTKARNNHSAHDDGAEKVEKVPKKENNGS